VTDESGAQAARIVYGAWGEQLSVNDSVPGGLDVRFVGGLGVRNDSASGLIYMRHRWYDSQLGRFISRDPIGLEGGHHLYQYADGNPTTLIDPEGEEPRPNPSPSPGPPVPLNPTWGPPDFDLGCNYSDCIANCFDHYNFAGDFGAGALTVAGVSFPKKWAKRIFKIRVSGVGGITPYTGFPSIASEKLKMGRGNWLRRYGKVANRAWLAYGGYLAGAELGCLTICKAAHP
jgi:RHS repeat-associated protein